MMIMLADLTSLSDNPAELKALVALLGNEVKAQALLIEKLKHPLAVINRQRFGTRSESLYQLNMVFSEDRQIAEAAGVPVDTAEAATETSAGRQHSRKSLPEHLVRHDQVLAPGSSCRRCGGSMKTLGTDITEELEICPRPLRGQSHPSPAHGLFMLRSRRAGDFAIAADREGPSGSGPAGACPGLQVRRSSSAVPAGADIRSGRHRA